MQIYRASQDHLKKKVERSNSSALFRLPYIITRKEVTPMDEEKRIDVEPLDDDFADAALAKPEDKEPEVVEEKSQEETAPEEKHEELPENNS